MWRRKKNLKLEFSAVCALIIPVCFFALPCKMSSLPPDERLSPFTGAMNDNPTLARDTKTDNLPLNPSSSTSFLSSLFPFLAESNYDRTTVLLYLFVATILLLHAFAFLFWLLYFLKDLATNKTASVIQSQADRKTRTKATKPIEREASFDPPRGLADSSGANSHKSVSPLSTMARERGDTSLRRRPKPST